MSYSRFSNENDFNEKLKKISKEDIITNSGLPVFYTEDSLYYEPNNRNSLVIGIEGSGKTQAIYLPMLKMSILAGESIVCYDRNNEIQNIMKGLLEENNYKIYNNDSFNPLKVPYEMFKTNENKAFELVDDIAYYYFKIEKGEDPFWINSARNYFKGLCMYLLKKDTCPNLKSLNDLSNEIEKDSKKFFDSLEEDSKEKILLASILQAPTETRGSILSVFRLGLNYLLLSSNFEGDSFDINNEKCIIFLNESEKVDNTLLLDQLLKIKNSERQLHIMIDSLDNMYPLKDILTVLNMSRSKNIKFTASTFGIKSLRHNYEEILDGILNNFTNLVYLLTTDNETLDFISNMCGKKEDGKELVTVFDIMNLKIFEAIILIPRMFPIKTKLVPYYELT